MYWPIKNNEPLFPDSPGRYGAIRKHDIHTGIDLYCEINQEIVAIEDGIVISIEAFTGEHAVPPTPWWNNTCAVLIKGSSGVIVYGEVTPSVSINDRVKAGDTIAIVNTAVLKKFKGRPMVMLHLELMSDEASQTICWNLGDPKPDLLRNPEPLLRSITSSIQLFDLTNYNNRSYRAYNE